MRPATLKKLVSVQSARLAEIGLMISGIKEKSRDSLNSSIITSRVESVREIWVEARKTHAEIIASDEAETDSYVTNSVFSSIQTAYEDALDYLLTLAVEFERENGSTRSCESQQDSSLRAVKLPKLDLPTFSGKYEDWESFCDCFTSLVHTAARIDDSTKLHYLKFWPSSAAADLVKDVATTSANYASTWQALKNRFYNPRITVSNHLNALLNLPHLKRESAVELRTFTDESQRIVRVLTNLKMPVKHWDIWLVHIISSRLDPESRKLWESELSAKDHAPSIDMASYETVHMSYFPTFSELSKFLEKCAHALSMIIYGADNNKIDKRTYSSNNKSLLGSRKVFHASARQLYKSNTPKCPLCSGIHALSKCSQFLSKTPYARRADVRHLRLCYNCLGRHRFRECPSTSRCNTCREKHHSLIHFGAKALPQATPQSNGKAREESSVPSAGINVHTANVSIPKYTAILATAQVNITGPCGAQTRVRALLDQGSEGSFVTEATAQLLGLSKKRVKIPLSVVGGTAAGYTRAKTSFTIQSLADPNFKINIEALILPRLTSQLPARRPVNFDLGLFAELTLADPQFYVPDSVDLLLGADVYAKLLRPGLKRFTTTKLIAQDTTLGWILSGPAENYALRRAEQVSPTVLQSLHCVPRNELLEALEKFWVLEELPHTGPRPTPEEEACEQLFNDTHTQEIDGRYVVRLPIKAGRPEVGDESRRMAIGSLKYMHRRFMNDPAMAYTYREFMATYEKLGHMTRILDADLKNTSAWYLPHHAVTNASKLRVVFDASRRMRDRSCLNDFLMAGPALQRDLALILLNWRQYRYVFMADIIKMFRQIRVAAADQDFQRIVWSPNGHEPPVDYRLNTVTYGTVCAPYLAIRTLNQLAQDERSRFPLGACCLESETYVDDTFAGADDLPSAIRKRIELTEILKSAGIELDKWAANDRKLLPPCLKQKEADVSIEIDREDSIKTLGVYWNPKQDEFSFRALKIDCSSETLTKRKILSNIARLFDPLGWLSPINVTAKIIMQDLWIQKISWDASLPHDLCERWRMSGKHQCEIHGFSDASSRAYAAAVYIRVRNNDDCYRVTLLAAKTKVAPVKTISIPNLELCGATLLVKLVRHLKTLKFLEEYPIILWSDSEIVIKWLKKHPSNWKTFVANRVSQIQTTLPEAQWFHVRSKDNPADIASRGASTSDLSESELWWHGPPWLSTSSVHWPQPSETTQVLHATVNAAEPDILTRFSSLTRLMRVIAYCLRPINKLRRCKSGLSPLPTSLSATELTAARSCIIRLAQRSAFSEEIKILKAGRHLSKRSPLSKLNPFLTEEDEIIRVGGRLSNSALHYERKHPPILPRNSNLSRLFIRYAHKLTLHGGPNLTSNALIQHVWVMGRRQLVKSAICKCIRCQRIKPRLAQVSIRAKKGRGNRSYKGYIALFICFATRAIHLEVVSDLTTPTFIAAYRRFVSRRGVCRNLYSDNATNFRGADSELRAMFNAASEFYQSAAATLANEGTTWNFIPPTTPHYGGLWKAGVKSTKYHLKRAFGEHTLTFEEFGTVLTEIEACLNSRPLCPLTTDIDDLSVLTPSHFLIGDTPGLIPDQDPPDVPVNRLSRFQLMQRIRSQFWKRWSVEYLQHLQERGKWRQPTENFVVDRLVALKDDRYPPTKWPLGRIIETHPGPDGYVRVVTVKTASNTFRRYIARLCPLVMDNENQPTDAKE